MHTSDYLRCLRRKQTVTPGYPPHLRNVTAISCKMHNFFIWLKACCFLKIPINVGGSEKSRLWLGIGSSKKNLCVATEISGKCLNWPPSARMDASSLFATDQLHRVSSTNPQYGRVAEASCCDVGWISAEHSVMDDAVDQWRKRLEACIHAERGHFEHLL